MTAQRRYYRYPKNVIGRHTKTTQHLRKKRREYSNYIILQNKTRPPKTNAQKASKRKKRSIIKTTIKK